MARVSESYGCIENRIRRERPERTRSTREGSAGFSICAVALCSAVLYAIYRLTGARLGGLFGGGGA